MSCLRHVGKRSKRKVPDECGGVKDSIQQVSTVSQASEAKADSSVRVWSAADFNILNELQKPIVVVSPGGYAVSHRCVDYFTVATVCY